ncbi:nitroreductase family protein [Nocardia xishanensis]|uniref:Nitroreductase family protein n=1 Tax=Nocardia xishanensis TaxID=238964 RepID=A0ABW7XCI0_9NOCA
MIDTRYAALRDLLDNRWTCRQFLPDPVPHETIEQILSLAQRTPSWCNTQPWQLTITEQPTTDRFRKELLAHIEEAGVATDLPFPAEYTGVYRDRRRECGAQLYESVNVARGDHAGTLRQMVRNFELFDAPHVAILTTSRDLGVYGAVDCGLYLMTVLLAVESLGLAAAPQAALASYSPFLHEYFDIPADRNVVAGISFGYPDREHPVNAFRTTRAPLPDTITWHTT